MTGAAWGIAVTQIAGVLSVSRTTVRTALRRAEPIVDEVEARTRTPQAFPTMPNTVIAERIGDPGR